MHSKLVIPVADVVVVELLYEERALKIAFLIIIGEVNLRNSESPRELESFVCGRGAGEQRISCVAIHASWSKYDAASLAAE